MDYRDFENENGREENIIEETGNISFNREDMRDGAAAPEPEGDRIEAAREEEHVKNGRTGGPGPRGPWNNESRRGPEGPRGPEGRPFPYGNEGRFGPGGFGGHSFPRGGEGCPRPMGPRGAYPFPDGGEGRMGGRMPGCVPPPRFHHRPAMSPGFEPEAERRERYASLGLKEKITFQLKALGHILRMMPGTRDGQNRVLSILLDKGTLSQRELMELADIRSASLSELVMKLEMNGYVRRFPNPRDHRSVSVSLTEAGCLAARALRDSRVDLYEGLTEEEMENLLAMLEKLGRQWQGMLPGAAARRAPLDDSFKA